MFTVGDQVRIRVSSQFHGRSAAMNPDNSVVGVVREVEEGEFSVVVQWPSGGGNSYREEDLQLASSVATASPKKKVVTDASLIRAAKDLILSEPDRGSNGEAVHLLRMEGQRPRISTGPCHGFIRNSGRAESVAIVSRMVREAGPPQGGQAHLTEAELTAYVDWLLNRSPYADCFLYKSAPNALREKSIVARVDVPANMLQGALITSRNTWEYWPQVKLFLALVEKGVPENYAFPMAFFVSTDGGKVRVAPRCGDHTAVNCSDMRPEGLLAFVNSTPLYTTEPYNEQGCYQGVQRAWNGKGKRIMDTFEGLFNRHGKRTKCLNPFAKAIARADKEGRAMTVSQYAEFLMAQYNTFTGQ